MFSPLTRLTLAHFGQCRREVPDITLWAHPSLGTGCPLQVFCGKHQKLVRGAGCPSHAHAAFIDRCLSDAANPAIWDMNAVTDAPSFAVRMLPVTR